MKRISLPQISRSRLEKLFTSQTNGQSKLSLVRDAKGNVYKYKINTELNELPFTDPSFLLNKRHIYFEPYGKPLEDYDILIDYREKIVGIAKKYNFPLPISARNRANFDKDIGKELWENKHEIGLNILNASREGVWNYLQGLLLPDIVAWRWRNPDGTFSTDRINRLSRGALSNAWWRYCVLSANDKYPISEWMDHLTQDDVVQIVERPSMRGHYNVVIPFAKKVSKLRNEDNSCYSGEELNRLIRAAAIRLRIYVGTKNTWHSIEDNIDFEPIIDGLFEEAQKMIEQ